MFLKKRFALCFFGEVSPLECECPHSIRDSSSSMWCNSIHLHTSLLDSWERAKANSLILHIDSINLVTKESANANLVITKAHIIWYQSWKIRIVCLLGLFVCFYFVVCWTSDWVLWFFFVIEANHAKWDGEISTRTTSTTRWCNGCFGLNLSDYPYPFLETMNDRMNRI